MDYNKMTAAQVRAAGRYDGWAEASFVLTYGRPSPRRAPEFTDPKKAERYAEGVKIGQERHAADLEVDGKPITRDAAAINARLRERSASTPIRVEVVAHRATRKSAERYVAAFANELGDTVSWNGRENIPIHVEWTVVPAAPGFDIVSTVTRRS